MYNLLYLENPLEQDVQGTLKFEEPLEIQLQKNKIFANNFEPVVTQVDKVEVALPTSRVIGETRSLDDLMMAGTRVPTAGRGRPENPGGSGGKGGGRPDNRGGSGGHESPEEEAAGNNLSYPVIWSEGISKTLRGTYGEANLIEAEIVYVDGEPVYPQQAESTWQAESLDASGNPVVVNWIDWGDNLESVDWYTRSMVRTEVVLIKDLATPMEQFEMKHISGWGIDELWGTTGEVLDSDQATVYSHGARLTIQKLGVERDDEQLDTLIWEPGEGWTEPAGTAVNLINEPIYNMAVHEGGDGPGYYSAEINVKGKVIFGYTWNVRNLNDPTDGTAAGDYRITFSLDETFDGTDLNTFFEEKVTEILMPIEEEGVALEAVTLEDEGGSSPEGGGEAQIDFTNNLTYIDIRILERESGGGGGGGRPHETPDLISLGASDSVLLSQEDPLKGQFQGLYFANGLGIDELPITQVDNSI
jgi:hypothetical protein